jgi:hypothetical protein
MVAESSSFPSAADAVTRARLGRPAGRRRRRGRPGCPDACYAVRHSVRVLCPPRGRTDLHGRADVRCPGDRCPRDRCDPGVRTDRRPVSAASAAALSAPRWIGIHRCGGAATWPRGTRVWSSCGIRDRLDHLPEPGWPSRPDGLASHGRVAQVGGIDYAPWSSWEAQGRVAWSLRAFRAALRLALAAAACSERRPLQAGGALTCGYEGGGEGI